MVTKETKTVSNYGLNRSLKDFSSRLLSWQRAKAKWNTKRLK